MSKAAAVLLTIMAALALTVGMAGASGDDHVLTVDGVQYSPTKVVGNGATAHYETPGANPGAASTPRHTWTGNGSEQLPCQGGIHWIDNANVLTISHCLESSGGTTTVPPTTTTAPPQTTVPPSTTVPTCPIADAIDAGWTPDGDVPCGHTPEPPFLGSFTQTATATCQADGTYLVTFIITHTGGTTLTVGTSDIMQGGSVEGGPGAKFLGYTTGTAAEVITHSVTVTVDGFTSTSTHSITLPAEACPVPVTTTTVPTIGPELALTGPSTLTAGLALAGAALLTMGGTALAIARKES